MRRLSIVGLTALVSLCSAAAIGSPGDPDLTFGNLGIADLPVNLGQAGVAPVQGVLLPSGAVLLVIQSIFPGGTPSNALRIDPSGTIDRSFGDNGFLPASSFCQTGEQPCYDITALAVQQDGSIIAGILSRDGRRASGLVKYTADGLLDTGFAQAGVANTPCFDEVASLAILPDGKIVVGGESGSVARLLPTGAFDLVFGSDGCVETTFSESVLAVAVQPDGNVLFITAGYAPDPSVVGRLRTDGSIDSTFGTNGVVRLFVGYQSMFATTLLLQPDGRIIAIGAIYFFDLAGSVSQTRVALIRLTPDGVPDTTFGTAGTVIADFGAAGSVAAYATSGALQPDGKVVIVATMQDPPIFAGCPTCFYFTRVGVARFNVDGTPDLTFAGRGTTLLWSEYGSAAGFTAVRPDGRILIGGSVATKYITSVHFVYTISDLAMFQLQGGSGTALHPYREGWAIEYFFGGFGHYFITAEPYEIVSLDTSNGGWIRTGKSFKVWTEAAPNLSPVCRFFSGQAFAPKSSHFYTPYQAECVSVKLGGVWQFEGNVFELRLPSGPPGQGTCAAGSAPLYRLYNNGQGGAPNHRYTDDLAVLNQMVAQGWSFEGEAQTKVFACIPPSF
jgi:uncharacterized delta-60 repeat protein